MQAYLYFYSLITMDMTRKQFTNVDKPEGVYAPMNTFANIPNIPGGPEGGGPAELRHAVFQRLAGPDQGADDRLSSRYAWALLPAADAGHVDRRFRVPGLAHDRNPGRRLCRDPPGWSGSLPAGVVRIDAPTPYVWIIGRTKTDGPADYAAVNKI